MKVFPGVRARMGRWTYYVVRMTMKDLASSVEFASDTYDSPILDEALQRALNVSRSKKEIVSYLQKQDDRFFNSIVIAAIGGKPKWFSIDMADNPTFAIMADDPSLKDAFGVLRFSDGEHFYALDGQHRLRAIKDLVDPSSDAARNAPSNFAEEQISVVLVVPGDAEDVAIFRQRFRRLFGHLNRYAKPMDMATSIIMDEDDSFAIVTRRLFSEHAFFKTVGPHRESKVVYMDKGKNMRSGQVHLTTLEVLYQLNTELLRSAHHLNSGWGTDGPLSVETFIRFRPSDESTIDALFEELSTIWNALLDVLPVLKEDPSKMRNHAVVDLPLEERDSEQDNLLFWPIGQQILAGVARCLLDASGVEPTDSVAAKTALAPLARVPWQLDESPWRHLLLIKTQDDHGEWTMRSEERKKCVTLSISMLCGLLSGELNEVAVEELRGSWKSYLRTPADVSSVEIDEMWQAFVEKVSGK